MGGLILQCLCKSRLSLSFTRLLPKEVYVSRGLTVAVFHCNKLICIKLCLFIYIFNMLSKMRCSQMYSCFILFISADLRRKLITFDSSPEVIAAIIATLCKVQYLTYFFMVLRSCQYIIVTLLQSSLFRGLFKLLFLSHCSSVKCSQRKE